MHNNGMNADPPTARFQMEHQPRRPGYARRYAPMVLSMRIVTLAGIVCLGFLLGCGADNESPTALPSAPAQQESNVDDAFPRLVWQSAGTAGESVEHSGGPVSASEAGIQLMTDKFLELDWEDPESAPSFAVELSEDTRLSITLSLSDSVHTVATSTRPGPPLGNTTTSIIRRSTPLKDTSQALALLEAFLKSNGEDFESIADWQAEDADAPSRSDGKGA